MPASATGVAHARAGILGNPSDGYDGKAIACSVHNFAARATLEPSDDFAVVSGAERLELDVVDGVPAPCVTAVTDGLSPLACAALHRFCRHVHPSVRLNAPFTLTIETDIPRQVGLAGSSAAIIATMRALAVRFDVTIPPFELAEQSLATELEDLGIACGAMDRVIQAYEGVMEMDLAAPRSEGAYRRIDPALIPPALIAWDPEGGASSGVAHGDLRSRWLRGDAEVIETIEALRHVVDQGVLALEARDRSTFANLVDFNFELRCRVFSVGDRDRQMVDIARQLGAAAKLCGSGGAVLVVPRHESDLAEIAGYYEAAGYRSFRPIIR